MELTARARRFGRWWAIDVDEIPNIHTQTRRLSQIPEMVLDAASMLDDQPPEGFVVEVVPILDDQIEAARIHIATMRASAARSEAEATATAGLLVARLRSEGVTVRDIARILGLSPQRISQIANA